MRFLAPVSLDVLLYVTEGFLPFLQIFYSEMYQKGNFDQTQVEGETTNKIYEAMLVRLLQVMCIQVTYASIAGFPHSTQLQERLLLPGSPSAALLPCPLPHQTILTV